MAINRLIEIFQEMLTFCAWAGLELTLFRKYVCEELMGFNICETR